MKLFVYKTLFAILSVYILYEFTIGHKISQIQSDLNNFYSRENLAIIKNKLRKEMISAVSKDEYINKEDSELINKFLEKIQEDLNNAKTE